MARRGAVSTETLATLGAARLAALLMELGEADASVRKRLVLAVAEAGGPAAQIKAIDRRLAALAGARAFIPWERARAFAADLDGLRHAIAQGLAPADPAAAAERLARLLRTSDKVLERVDDSEGRIGAVYSRALTDLAAAWAAMPARDPQALARDLFALLEADGFGVLSEAVEAAASALGPDGLAALRALIEACLAAAPPPGERESWTSRRLRLLLADIADAAGDVDAYIAAETAAGHPDIAGIAERLLGAGRPGEALEWLDRPHAGTRVRFARRIDLAGAFAAGAIDPIDMERGQLRVRALETIGRADEAQALRWRLFEGSLDPDPLRDFIARLPDFEDFAHLDKAVALAASHRNVLIGLEFLVEWPDLKAAAALVMNRRGELDGRYYEVLQPAAEALAESHPAAATVLLRAMIDSVLARAASGAYGHAAANLAHCAALADGVADWNAAGLAPHAEYAAALHARHGRKSGFWSRVGT
jgi:hypothetical protein